MKEKYIDMSYLRDCFEQKAKQLDFGVEVLDRKEAFQQIASADWEELIWEFRNENLLKKDGRVRSGMGIIWNEQAAYFRQDIAPKIEAYLSQYALPKTALDSILFDISTLRNYKLLQEEFEISSPFHDHLLYIYEQGYIPVGYKGEYPEGQFKVFKLSNN